MLPRKKNALTVLDWVERLFVSTSNSTEDCSRTHPSHSIHHVSGIHTEEHYEQEGNVRNLTSPTDDESQVISPFDYEVNKRDANEKMATSDDSNLEAFFNLPGNDVCCDCGIKAPKWVSINIGSLICIACSGVHRKLGTHISQVRSLTLDHLAPEVVENLIDIGGNIQINSHYEAKPLESYPKPSSDKNEVNTLYREEYIIAKYQQKLFATDRNEEQALNSKPVNSPLGTENLSEDEKEKVAKFGKKSSLYNSWKNSTSSQSTTKGMVEFIGMLSVTVIAGYQLISCDVNGFSDPFVIIGCGKLLDTPSEVYPGQIVKTSIKMKTLDPVWNETLNTCICDLKTDILHLECMDWDRLTEDDFMGNVSIPLSELFGNTDATQPVRKRLALKGVKRGEIEIEAKFISLK